MKITAELSATIKVNPNKSVRASVTAETDKNENIQIGAMRETVENLVQGYGNDAPEIRMKSNTQQRAVKMVSEKQLGMLRYMLMSNKIPESDFCRRHSVHRLNELTMADARIAIQELKLDETFERP